MEIDFENEYFYVIYGDEFINIKRGKISAVSHMGNNNFIYKIGKENTSKIFKDASDVKEFIIQEYEYKINQLKNNMKYIKNEVSFEDYFLKNKEYLFSL